MHQNFPAKLFHFFPSRQICVGSNFAQTINVAAKERAFFCSQPFINGSRPFDVECLVPWRCHGSLCDGPSQTFP